MHIKMLNYYYNMSDVNDSNSYIANGIQNSAVSGLIFVGGAKKTIIKWDEMILNDLNVHCVAKMVIINFFVFEYDIFGNLMKKIRSCSGYSMHSISAFISDKIK